MKGVNKVIIIGNVGNDPESRTFQNGGSVTNISVATSESWRDKESGQQQERTEWHRVVLRDRGNYHLGQIAAQYLKKGMKVYIEGSLRTRKYQAQDGSDRYTTEIIAEQMQMLDGKDQASPRDYQEQQRQDYRQQQDASAHRAPPPGMEDFDDDIPF